MGEKYLAGIQHKYRETVLFFPRQGQTCHAYCSYCFRWPQFAGEPAWKIISSKVSELVEYVLAHPEVTSVLITGGDPMIMSASRLRGYITPLLALEQLETIRIGTKALSFWPRRFVTDQDADELLLLFSDIRMADKNLSLMAHFSHPREMESPIVAKAVRRIQNAGATIRTQSPLIRSINDSPELWSSMWRRQIQLGIVPYYMFIERDTGPHDYFSVPLFRAYEIFRAAYNSVSGLARTVRGPSMSATPGQDLRRWNGNDRRATGFRASLHSGTRSRPG